MTASQPTGGYIVAMRRRRYWVWGELITVYWGIPVTEPWDDPEEPIVAFEWLPRPDQAYAFTEEEAHERAAALEAKGWNFVDVEPLDRPLLLAMGDPK